MYITKVKTVPSFFSCKQNFETRPWRFEWLLSCRVVQMTLRWSYLAGNLFLEDESICDFLEVRFSVGTTVATKVISHWMNWWHRTKLWTLSKRWHQLNSQGSQFSLSAARGKLFAPQIKVKCPRTNQRSDLVPALNADFCLYLIIFWYPWV